MKKYGVAYDDGDEVVGGQIMADSEEHAEEICEQNGWTFLGEIVSVVHANTFSKRLN